MMTLLLAASACCFCLLPLLHAQTQRIPIESKARMVKLFNKEPLAAPKPSDKHAVAAAHASPHAIKEEVKHVAHAINTLAWAQQLGAKTYAKAEHRVSDVFLMYF